MTADPTLDAPAPDYDDEEQPYERLRELDDGERDPGLRPALRRERGVCVMHRVKSQLESEGPRTADLGALAWITNYERLIGKGERPPCACARTKRGGKRS